MLDRLAMMPELRDVPTIVVTGRDGDAVDEQAHESGAVRVFRKPADPDALLEAVRQASTAPEAEKALVLVVEDDDDVRGGLARTLRSGGYRVGVASDGAMALVQAKKLRPDLVLLDLGLPCGDGVTVLERLRTIDEVADTPVVVLSGRAPSDHAREVQAAGADGFMQKPVGAHELLRQVGAMLPSTAAVS